jgi:hypothetical protein
LPTALNDGEALGCQERLPCPLIGYEASQGFQPRCAASNQHSTTQTTDLNLWQNRSSLNGFPRDPNFNWHLASKQPCPNAKHNSKQTSNQTGSLCAGLTSTFGGSSSIFFAALSNFRDDRICANTLLRRAINSLRPDSMLATFQICIRSRLPTK